MQYRYARCTRSVLGVAGKQSCICSILNSVQLYTHLVPVLYLVLQYRVVGLYSPGEVIAVLLPAVLFAGDGGGRGTACTRVAQWKHSQSMIKCHGF